MKDKEIKKIKDEDHGDILTSSVKGRNAKEFQKLTHGLAGRIYKGIPGTTLFASKPAPLKEITYSKLLHLGSYNYSGLNNDVRILEAAKKAVDEYGITTSGVRILNGTSDLHIKFEDQLARFLHVEDTVTYSSGFSANISVLACLCSKGDLIFSDELNHLSLIDGMILSKADVVKYKHNNMDDLQKLLANNTKTGIKKFIVTDSIFSMDGDIANLTQIISLAEKYKCHLIVDEAHAIAAYGPNGRGVVASLGMSDKVDIITGSLSKGLPGIGGFAAGRKIVMDTLRYGSDGYLFSASLPPPILAGLMTGIDILESTPEIQEKLNYNAKYLNENLKRLGFNTMNSMTAIIPVLMPSAEIALKFGTRLQEEGLYVNPVTFPAVPKESPRIRLNVSAALSQEDIDFSLRLFVQIGMELNIIDNGSSVKNSPIKMLQAKL